jgi:hypothetical protein
MPLPPGRSYRTSGPRPVVDPNVPFELRDVTRSFIEALQRDALPADVGSTPLSDVVRLALHRYMTRAHAIGRDRQDVARDLEALAALHAPRTLPEDERAELIEAVRVTALGEF